METFNETIVLVSMYFFVIFEALGHDVKTTFLIGYLVIGVISLHILTNMFLIIRKTFYFKLQKLKLWQAKRNYKTHRKRLQAGIALRH